LTRPTRPAFAQAKSLNFFDTQFFLDEYRAVFPVNVTFPKGLLVRVRQPRHARDMADQQPERHNGGDGQDCKDNPSPAFMPRELGLSAGQSLQRFIPVSTIGHFP
jgi:hypothetical protein